MRPGDVTTKDRFAHAFAERLLAECPSDTPGLRAWRDDLRERIAAGVRETLTKQGPLPEGDMDALLSML